MLPILTIVIPVLDEEQTLPRCLLSIASQDYPRDRLEVLVADGGSGDRSREVVECFSSELEIRLVDNSARGEAEWGKALAIRAARGELIQCMDADMWLTSSSMLRAIAVPLAEDASLAGAIASYSVASELSAWARYLSFDRLQRDPLLEQLTPDVSSFIIAIRPGYAICEFTMPSMPPVGGTTMFRRAEIDLSRWKGYFREVDHPAYLVKKGRTRFAYVSQVGWAHDHCESLVELVKKRLRNLVDLESSLLSEVTTDFVWVHLPTLRAKLELVRWIAGTNLVLPRLVEGVRQAARVKRWEPLLRPVVAVAVTDAVLVRLVTSARGRELIRVALASTSDARGF